MYELPGHRTFSSSSTRRVNSAWTDTSGFESQDLDYYGDAIEDLSIISDDEDSFASSFGGTLPVAPAFKTLSEAVLVADRLDNRSASLRTLRSGISAVPPLSATPSGMQLSVNGWLVQLDRVLGEELNGGVRPGQDHLLEKLSARRLKVLATGGS